MNFFDTLQLATEHERTRLLSAGLIQDTLAGRTTLARYVGFLEQAYHHVRHTVPLLMACGSRLPDRYAALRTAVAHYIAEENGHEQWILDDIAACGKNAALARAGTPHVATELMVSYAYHQIDRRNPLGFFGMVHVLEGTSTAVATRAAEVLQRTLGLPSQAFNYLTSHGSLDLEHVRYFAELMNQIHDLRDQTDIVHCARVFYRLYADVLDSIPSPAPSRTAPSEAA